MGEVPLAANSWLKVDHCASGVKGRKITDEETEGLIKSEAVHSKDPRTDGNVTADTRQQAKWA